MRLAVVRRFGFGRVSAAARHGVNAVRRAQPGRHGRITPPAVYASGRRAIEDGTRWPLVEQQVISVTGPVGVSRLGVVDAHDHLFLRSPAFAGQELDDLDRAIDEVRDGAVSGIGTIVEMTPIGLGRRPDLLRRVAETTGVTIIAASGYHRDAHR